MRPWSGPAASCSTLDGGAVPQPDVVAAAALSPAATVVAGEVFEELGVGDREASVLCERFGT